MVVVTTGLGIGPMYALRRLSKASKYSVPLACFCPRVRLRAGVSCQVYTGAPQSSTYSHPSIHSRTPSSAYTEKMYSSDERACTCPVQRALKSTSMMPGAGLLSPQLKFTSGSSREWCGAPLTSKLLKYSPASPVPSPGGSRMGVGVAVGVGVSVGVGVW